MNLKSVICALAALSLFVACEEEVKTPKVEEPEVELQFVTDNVVIPIDLKAEIVLNVEPVSKSTKVEFVNTDENVVAISGKKIKDGEITLTLEGLTLGTATIAAVLDDKYEQCEVSVVPVSVESIELDKTTLDIDVNTNYTFSVKILPQNATSPLVEWKSSNETVAIVNRGVVTGLSEGEAVITASVGKVSAQCKVNVHVVKGESLTLDVTSAEIVEGETFLTTATILPKDVTLKSMKWSVSGDEGIIEFEVIDPKEGDNQTSAKVIGLKEGNAVLKVECAGLEAECTVAVKAKEVPVLEPKIGDYYYSDGTWSDGGFLGFAEDGITARWAESKPAPIEGKTVIGIIFQTDESRISAKEKSLGYTHGLVMAIRSAHGTESPLTRYSFDTSFDTIPNKRTGVAWYGDIEGYQWTLNILEAYPGEKIQKCPAFDFTTTDFKPSAPTGTSGWYVPSIGQVWDMLSVFCGGEVAEHLKTLRTYGSDITYYYKYGGDLKLSYDPIAALNSVMSAVPADMKEEFVLSAKRGASNLCEIMSSSLYDNEGDGAVCIFWLYDTGQLETVCDWTDQTVVCRPILSF